jgi:hypothetical protein
MVQELAAPSAKVGQFSLGDLVEGEVVTPRAEIDIIGVRLPDDLHPEQTFVEDSRFLEIGHAERQMA